MSRMWLILPMLLLAVSVGAQPRGGGPPGGVDHHRDPRLQYGGLLYVEAVSTHSDSAGLARVDMLFRVSYDFMVFERVGGSVTDSLFRAGVDISIDLQRNGTFIGSSTIGGRAAAAQYNETDSRGRFLLLQRTLYLDAGEYTAVIVATDRGSRNERRMNVSFVARDLTRELGAPIVLDPASPRDALVPRVHGYGGSMPFAAPVRIAVPVPDAGEGEWTVRLRRDRDGTTVMESGPQPSAVLRGYGLPKTAGMVEDFALVQRSGDERAMLLFDLPFDSVDVAPYTLTVQRDHQGRRDTVSLNTAVFWRDMPYALRNIPQAVKDMRYILTRGQLEEMTDGDEETQRRQLRRFWEERDPTPGTAYNEHMTEYFRRVDQARIKFQTLYEPDGVDTDRGKVYILFGPPENTQRVLESGEPGMEIWYYPSLGKTFRFVDKQRDGNLRLLEE